jgi:HNH endonuclease
MYRRPLELRMGRGRYCSRACRNRAHPPKGRRGPNPAMRGARNPAWKGGVTYRKRRGNYVSVRYVRAPTWALAMARKDGYVMEHRLLMARMAGRLLARAECVHHRDHDPLNNAPTNLELWPDNRTHKLAEHGRPVPGAACLLSLPV